MQRVNYVMTATTILNLALQMKFTAGLTTMLCLVVTKRLSDSVKVTTELVLQLQQRELRTQQLTDSQGRFGT